MTRELTPTLHMGRLHVRLEFKAADTWVGFYWSDNDFLYQYIHVWVCIVPMLPIHFLWERRTA